MRVAIAGAGIGGTTLAALLDRAGHEVVLLERATAFGEVGAGIQLSPNGVRILADLGLGDRLAAIGTMPERVVLRRWDDDAELLGRRQGTLPVERYGHPYYNVYRPDLVEVLAEAVDRVAVRFGAEVTGVRNLGPGAGRGAVVDLAGGSSVEADVVIGADGIHSAVRDAIFEPSPSRFSRSVAYRALVPRDRVPGLPVEVTNRMGPDRHLVSYFVGRNQRFLNLVCVVPEPTWDREGWNEPGDVGELRAQFAGWSPAVTDLLALVEEPVFRWSLHDRPPMQTWADGNIALLGDACHAMLPFMAQGACQAIEDAAVLARLLDGTTPAEVPAALATYEAIRQPRAAVFQRRSWRNATTFHLPDGPEQQARDAALARAAAAPDSAETPDPLAWIYGYDALTVPLEPPAPDEG